MEQPLDLSSTSSKKQVSSFHFYVFNNAYSQYAVHKIKTKNQNKPRIMRIRMNTH